MANKKGLFKRMIRPLVTLTVMVMMFTYVSYSWIRREWTPYIEQSNIMITTGGSLMFQFGQENTSGKTINDILGADFVNFQFLPVSNSTGSVEHFFTVNTRVPEGEEYYYRINDAIYQNPTDMGKDYGYLDFKFILYAPEDENDILRYVYLEEAYIKDATVGDSEVVKRDYAQAIRVAISYQDKTVIFADTNDRWLTDEQGKQYVLKSAVSAQKGADGKYVMDNQPFYNQVTNENGEFVGWEERTNWDDTNNAATLMSPIATRVEHFSNYNGEGENPSKALFSISGSDPVEINIRIWVEGSDLACDQSIAGGKIDLKLKFSSFIKK
jgi:hypothetical protein